MNIDYLFYDEEQRRHMRNVLRTIQWISLNYPTKLNNFIESFSLNQIKSKKWLIETMKDNIDFIEASQKQKEIFFKNTMEDYNTKKLEKRKLSKDDWLEKHKWVNGNVYTILGSWYGSILAPALISLDRTSRVCCLDMDQYVTRIGQILFSRTKRIHNETKNVFLDLNEEDWIKRIFKTSNFIINTSCEHMPPMKDWPYYSQCRNETYFILQSNNMFEENWHSTINSGELGTNFDPALFGTSRAEYIVGWDNGHINCVNNIDEFVDQATHPMMDIIYTGESDFYIPNIDSNFKRFMIICRLENE